METSKSAIVKSTFTCGRCSMLYCDYKRLLEHLYWRHGTESIWCRQCELKRWRYAAHMCHVLPIDYEIVEDTDLNLKNRESPPKDTPSFSERESDFCFCRKYIADVPMIGCDGPSCELQWYHLSCVGITSPPDGDWLCPTCDIVKDKSANLIKTGGET